MGKIQFQNLYNHPRLLYKFFPISKDYACKYLDSGVPAYIFTPNVPRAEIENSERFEVIDKWRAIVLDGMIFYTSPAFFNDPFDTVLPMAPEIIPSIEERKLIIEALKKLYRINKVDIDRLLYSRDFDRAMLITAEDLGIADEIQKILYEELKIPLHRYREAIAVACFSEVNDSKLMWAHYANSYTGFCIEYDFTKSYDVEFQKGIGKVIYTDERPQKGLCEDYRQYEKLLVSTKAECWSYEKEWRSICILPYGQYINKVYPIANVKKCITAIYLGCKMPQEYQEEIARYYKDSEVKVYKMVLRDDIFGFDFVEYGV